MAFLDDLGKKITQTGQDAAKKAKDLADVTKLNSQLGDAGRQLQESYRKLGEKYFELHRYNAEAPLSALCAEANEILDGIAATRLEIQRIKNMKLCPSCGFENAANASFCSQCSGKLPDLPEPEGAAKHCPVCGGEISPEALFCTKCGNKLA